MSQPQKILFTPGPLNTSMSVKEVMLRDLGSRDKEFINIVRSVRSALLKLAGLENEHEYDCVLMQGSGTFGIESVLSSAIPPQGHLLVLENGAYGRRMAEIAQIHRIRFTHASFQENTVPTPDIVASLLENDPTITHVAIVHCETTTGIFNDISAIGKVVKNRGKVYIVDAMSSFGAVPVDLVNDGIDFLISSSNKCIEGVPGFSFIIAKVDELENCKETQRTLSLNLYSQWTGLNSNGQFRFTPPVHTILALHQALKELEEEGGVEGRKRRYQKNHNTLVAGMLNLGFAPYLPEKHQGYIITSFLYPDHPNFNFNQFYQMLNEQGFVIYPGKLSSADCFRIGNIGRIDENHIQALLVAIRQVKEEMGF